MDFNNMAKPRILKNDLGIKLFWASLVSGGIAAVIQIISLTKNPWSLPPELLTGYLVLPLLATISLIAVVYLFANKNLAYLAAPLALNLIGTLITSNSVRSLGRLYAIQPLMVLFSVAWLVILAIPLFVEVNIKLAKANIFALLFFLNALTSLIFNTNLGSAFYLLSIGLILFAVDITTIKTKVIDPVLATGMNGSNGTSTSTPVELLELKGPGRCIFFSFITFGIYLLFWQYSLMKKIRLMGNESLLCGKEFCMWMFVPFYNAFWVMTRGRKLSSGAEKRGIKIPDDSVIYLLLNVVGLGIISTALIQESLNNIAYALASAGASKN